MGQKGLKLAILAKNRRFLADFFLHGKSPTISLKNGSKRAKISVFWPNIAAFQRIFSLAGHPPSDPLSPLSKKFAKNGYFWPKNANFSPF